MHRVLVRGCGFWSESDKSDPLEDWPDCAEARIAENGDKCKCSSNECNYINFKEDRRTKTTTELQVATEIGNGNDLENGGEEIGYKPANTLNMNARAVQIQIPKVLLMLTSFGAKVFVMTPKVLAN